MARPMRKEITAPNTRPQMSRPMPSGTPKQKPVKISNGVKGMQIRLTTTYTNMYRAHAAADLVRKKPAKDSAMPSIFVWSPSAESKARKATTAPKAMTSTCRFEGVLAFRVGSKRIEADLQLSTCIRTFKTA
mmetsp:Transcript_30198/g.83332  ORF Transcript_30198/g.83332 Transcript_30198/m.83332 type:complete len:132 (+) Transcript_30198:487-882(+)